MGMSASQARFLQLTARKSNIEYMGQQINQQRLSLANSSAGLFEKMLSLVAPKPPSSQDDKYYTQGYNFTDPRDELQKKIHWQTYEDALEDGAPPAASYFGTPTGLTIVSKLDGTVHTFAPSVLASPTPAQKSELLTALGVDTSKNSSGYRQDIRYITVENPIFTPDGELSTHQEQGLALLEFDNLNRLLRVTSLTDREYIGEANSPNFSLVAPDAGDSGAVSNLTNDGNILLGAPNPAAVYTPWALSGDPVVNPATGAASQLYQRTGSQEVAAIYQNTVTVVQQQLTDLGPVESAGDLTAKYGEAFNRYTYVDYAGVTQTRYAIGDGGQAQALQQLHALANAGVDVSEDFILMNDVDLSALPGGEWDIIDDFSGDFDGNLHTLSNLSVNNAGAATGVGMFGEIASSGVVKNLSLSGVSIDVGDGSSEIGALAGVNNGLITNAHVSGIDIMVNGNPGNSAIADFSNGQNTLGGLVGGNSGNIDRVSASGVINIGGTGLLDGVGSLVGCNGSATAVISLSTADVDICTDSNNMSCVNTFVGCDAVPGAYQNCYATGMIYMLDGVTVNPMTAYQDQYFSGHNAGTNVVDCYKVLSDGSSVYWNGTASNFIAASGAYTDGASQWSGQLSNGNLVWDLSSLPPTINFAAVNTEIQNLPGHSTNSWTESYTATSGTRFGNQYGAAFNVGNGENLTYVGEFNTELYYNDINKYEFEKAAYDFQIESINKATKNVQLQDKSLELKLKQLDTEHNAVQTEIEAVQKVVQKNTESSFKTFA